MVSNFTFTVYSMILELRIPYSAMINNKLIFLYNIERLPAIRAPGFIGNLWSLKIEVFLSVIST